MDIKDNKEKSRFEVEIEGSTAFVEYKTEPDVLVLTHTEVPKELGGRGVASEMVEVVLLQAELRGYKIKPECGFIKSYIEKHPEWKSIVKS